MLRIYRIFSCRHIHDFVRSAILLKGGDSRGVRQVSFSRGDYMVIVMLSCGRSDVHLCMKCYYAYSVLLLYILLN